MFRDEFLKSCFAYLPFYDGFDDALEGDVFLDTYNLNLDSYVNDYGYLITFTDNIKTTPDKSCPDNKIRQGQELYAFSRDGSVMDTGPMCTIYGKNVKDAKTNDISWVDIEGYKHTYSAESWNKRDLSCKEPVITLTHSQYNNIPSSEYPMNKERVCMKTSVNPCLLYTSPSPRDS